MVGAFAATHPFKRNSGLFRHFDTHNTSKLVVFGLNQLVGIDTLPIKGPCRLSMGPGALAELLQITAIGIDGEYIVIVLTDINIKHNASTVGRELRAYT